MPRSATLRIQSADQGWQSLGIERFGGVLPEGVKVSANGWGPDLLSGTLKRKPRSIFPDLATWTPCELEVGGVTVWDGALKEAPESDGSDFQIGVVGAGWQYHLDDDTNDKVWVHTRLPDWQDMRSILTAELGSAKACAVGQVSNDRGAIQLAFPKDSNPAVGSYVGVVLDLGPGGSTAARVSIDYETSNNSGLYLLYCRAATSPDSTSWPGNDAGWSATPITTAGASGTVAAASFATPQRYVHIFLYCNSAGAIGGDIWVKLKAVRIFTSAGYESGNVSILKTSDLVKGVLPWAPLLSQDTSLIQATTFNWPEFAPFDEKTAREIIEAPNAAERMQARLRIGRQLEYRPYPTAPLFEIGEWSNAVFKDTSAGSGQEVYNKVKVKGTGPDGSKLTIVRTQSGTILDRLPGGARTRTKVLPVSIGLNTALGNKLGDAFLSVHKTTPLKGEVSATGHGAVRRVISGEGMDPAHLLLHTGEMLRLSHRIDPDTGNWGRDGQVARVEYDLDSETAQVSLDNQRDNFEALLARLGAVIGGGA